MSSAPNITGYFNDTPVRLLADATLGGERCVLVEWPNTDRQWLSAKDVTLSPKSETSSKDADSGTAG